MREAKALAQREEEEEGRQAAELRLIQEKEAERTRQRLRLEEFNGSTHGAFFRDLQIHYSEKMAQGGGQDENVMRFYARDSLHRLRTLLERDRLLDRLATLHGLTGRISEPHRLSTIQDVDTWLGSTLEDRVVKNAFHGGLRTIWRHSAIDGEFPMMAPKAAFLSMLGLLHNIHQTFPRDERVNQAVLQAYFWIVDQNDACPAGLLARSFMLGEAVSKLLVGGLERPFEK